MSDRWDFIEKEMDDNFLRKVEIDEKIRNNFHECGDLFTQKYCNHPVNSEQYGDKYINEIFYGYKVKLHRVKKKFRKLWFKLFDW